MRLTRRHHVIVRRFVLQHQPHRADIILRPSPIALVFQIAQNKIGIETSRDPRDRACDLARDEIFSASRRFMVVKNSVANE